MKQNEMMIGPCLRGRWRGQFDTELTVCFLVMTQVSSFCVIYNTFHSYT